MRIIYKIGKHIVKNTYVQQVDGGVVECVTMAGAWFNSVVGFLFFIFE